MGIKYKAGDKVGPYGHTLLERIEKTKSNHWKCLFLCGWCNKNTFVTTLDHITRKNHEYLSCGCKDQEVLEKKKDRIKNQDKNKTIFGAKKAREKHSPYKINTKWGHLTIKEITNKRDCSGNKIVKCICDCGKSDLLYEYSTSYLYNENYQRRCPLCKIKTVSSGEEKIQKILTDNGIQFFKEYIFENCFNPKTNYKLLFDFYLPDYNCCIEYDGIQHFKTNSYFQHNSLENRKDRDSIKDNFCKENNIKLIRIPYWDYNKISIEYIRNRVIL